ncbi:Uma2 family endonuclease [Botrimarina sp.]|uniref:Uma2 family endonuclease n=1 Tax=Botrimarina sp. TaxID=2795802 RepID=UPI0032EEE0A9
MSTVTDRKTEALIAELYKVEGKAEIVGGRIVRMSPTGDEPARAGGVVFASLLRFEEKLSGHGRAYPDNVAYLADLPNRKSFAPDASYYTGPRAGMKFLPQPPDFAVEVRSEGDYGPAAEEAMAAKRADYFAAGTKVVWDVDLLGEDTVRVYRDDDPTNPTTYKRGDIAEAEPAVPGWTMPVADLFE